MYQNSLDKTISMSIGLNHVVMTNYTGLMISIFNSIYYNQQYDIELYIKENLYQINKKTNLGWTALMITVSLERYTNIIAHQIAKLLIYYGADVNLQNNDGNTALLLASMRYNVMTQVNMMCPDYNPWRTIKFLLYADANVDLTNNDNLTVVDIIKDKYKYLELLQSCEKRKFMDKINDLQSQLNNIKNRFNVNNL